MKRIVDAALTALLLCLMAYQVTGESLHEWLGIAMTVLVIVHQFLNRRWYAALFKGKYHAYRIAATALNILLLTAFALTAFCGMSMSGHAVPFLYGMTKVSFARQMHLSMSHWAFVLMGLHLGFHIPAMAAKLGGNAKRALTAAFAVAAGVGLYLFLRSGMLDYMLFRVPFAFLNYDKAAALVFGENLLMLLFWAFAGTQLSLLLRRAGAKDNKALLPVTLLLTSVLLGLALNMTIPADSGNDAPSWTPQPEPTVSSPAPAATVSEPRPTIEASDDGFIRIEGGTFRMGSPETENWRIDDETQHSVTVSAFYIAPYETTQAEYASVMGENPGTFPGDGLPVENLSWLDAIRYANARSAAAGLTPAYELTENTVTWDRSADGYRLPTEAEWEYACRAGTLTPFNTEHSLSAESAASGMVTAAEAVTTVPTAGKALIAYFSWGGNTRGIAQEIARQTGADVFEISPVYPYSTSYNTVLMEAQEDQHRQARPELSGHVENMDKYDTILLGYPNWWASIPMPIASFLEEYDFAGKRIVPFCSHGGGRFGQSLTAIAKLTPDADLGEGLSVHYSGGSTLSEDISNWLKTNGII